MSETSTRSGSWCCSVWGHAILFCGGRRRLWLFFSLVGAVASRVVRFGAPVSAQFGTGHSRCLLLTILTMSFVSSVLFQVSNAF